MRSQGRAGPGRRERARQEGGPQAGPQRLPGSGGGASNAGQVARKKPHRDDQMATRWSWALAGAERGVGQLSQCFHKTAFAMEPFHFIFNKIINLHSFKSYRIPPGLQRAQCPSLPVPRPRSQSFSLVLTLFGIYLHTLIITPRC